VTIVPLPDSQRFLAVVDRTIQLVGEKVPLETLREMAEVFHVLCWEFPDWGVQRYFILSDSGEVESTSEWVGPVDSTITMDARTLHDIAFGYTSPIMAFFMGRLRVTGMPSAKLGKFLPLLEPFLASYRQACAEPRGESA